jgi:hypothetical protein
MLTGAAGVGKSKLEESIGRTLCASLGLPYSTFARATGSEYWEGYSHESVFSLGDIGFITGQQGKDMSAITASVLADMFTNNDFPLNMAFGEKGKMAFTSPLVLGSSNSWHGGLADVVTDPQAALRRFMWFEVTVNPRYARSGATEDSHQLDPTKVSPSTDDIHIIQEYGLDSRGIKVNRKKFTSTSAFLHYLRTSCKAHFARQKLVLQNTTGPKCSVCGLSVLSPAGVDCPADFHRRLEDEAIVLQTLPFVPTYECMWYMMMNAQVFAFLYLTYTTISKALALFVAALGVCISDYRAVKELFSYYFSFQR